MTTTTTTTPDSLAHPMAPGYHGHLAEIMYKRLVLKKFQKDLFKLRRAPSHDSFLLELKKAGSSGGGAVRSGVGRKQLPPVPPGAGAPDTTPRAADRRSTQDSSPNGIPQSYGPFFLEYSLMAEYNLLQRQRIPGIYVIPSAKSPLFWFGVVFVRQGLFQEGVFKFYVIVPDNYPDGDCPRVIFDPPIFHPVVDIETGELDVKRGFTKWRRNVNHIWQVLLYVRRIFYKIDTKNPLNPEAAVLYDKELDVFRRKVTETIRKCNEHIYDPPTTDDPHAIRFSRWDPSLHEEAKKQVLSPKKRSESETKNAQTSGLSWVKPGSTKAFSRQEASS